MSRPHPARWRTRAGSAGCAALTQAATGCATSLSVTAGPTLDTHAAPGTEGRLEAAAGVGNRTGRAYVSLAGGGGYLSHDTRGYGLLSPEVGFEEGKAVRYGGGLLYTARWLGDADPSLHNAGGLEAHFLGRVQSTGGESGGLYLGARLQAEVLGGRDPEPDRGLFGLSLMLQWTTFDTTGNRWGG
ncbi:MAG: hypothetical protein WKG00_11980 [Polyangiaceae bacterium]